MNLLQPRAGGAPLRGEVLSHVVSEGNSRLQRVRLGGDGTQRLRPAGPKPPYGAARLAAIPTGNGGGDAASAALTPRPPPHPVAAGSMDQSSRGHDRGRPDGTTRRVAPSQPGHLEEGHTREVDTSSREGDAQFKATDLVAVAAVTARQLLVGQRTEELQRT